MSLSESSPDFERRLDAAFAEYLRRRDAGEAVDLDAFLPEDTECAEALRACIEAEDCVRALARIVPTGSTRIAAEYDESLPDPPVEGLGHPRVLGDYELLEPIGRGGMGIIYKARQKSLGRIVALKVIREGELATPRALKRFRSEAQLAAGLQHPQIVSIHEIGEQEGLAYFSMDWISGQSLADVLQTGPLAPRRAADILVRVSQAMQYAHQQGLLHRDLKPSNILLDEQGQPLVTDFGLARPIGAASDLTQTGEIVGTVSYMSPEQAGAARSDQDLGPASDVYSLGAVLYALLVGHPPFQAENPLETLLQVRQQEPVSPRSLNPKIPKELDTICLKCLEKSPRKRYVQAQDLAADLERFLTGQPIQAKPASFFQRAWRWSLGHPGAASAMVLTLCFLLLTVGGVAIYGVHVQGLNQELQDANRDLTRTRSALLNSQAELETSLEKSQAARQRAEQSEHRLAELLYAANMRAASRAYQERDVREVDRLLRRQIPTVEASDFRGLEWPLLNRLSSPPHVELKGHFDDVQVVRYSPDGRWLATAGDDASVRVYQADTLQLYAVFRTGFQAIRGLAFDPTGEHLACCVEDGQVRLFEIHSQSNRRTISAHPQKACDAVWSQDGRVLFTSGDDAWIRLWDAQSGKPLGQIGPHQTGKAVIRLALSRDERFLASVSNSVCCVWDLTTKKHRFRYQEKTRITSVAFSPDGRWLSFGALNGRAHLVPCPDFPNPPAFSSPHGDAVEAVAFSPDGRWGADADRGGVLSVWPLTKDGAGHTHVVGDPERDSETDSHFILAHRDRILALAFSPDGRRIVTGGKGGIVRVWKREDLLHPKSPDSPLGPVTDLQYLSEGTILACEKGGVSAWNSQNGMHHEVIAKKHWHTLAVSPNQQIFAVGSSKGTIVVWDRQAGIETGRIHDPQLGIVLSLIYSSDGSRLVAQTVGGLIILDPKTMQRLDLLPPLRSNAIALSSNGRRLALSPVGYDQIELWDLETGTKIRTLDGHSAVIKSLAFSPDGQWLVSGSEDRLIKLWRLADGKLRFTLSGHRGRVTQVAFSPDGRSLLSTGWDGTLRIWSPTLGQELLSLGTPTDPQRDFYDLAISPDGRSVGHIVQGRLQFYETSEESFRPLRH